MILFLLAQAAAPAAAPETSCLATVQNDPERAIRAATAWHLAGGGALAKQCLGLAYAAQDRWSAAAIAFEQAAREAERGEPAAAANLFVQAGNARLAAGEPTPARAALDSALASSHLTGLARGEARLDRARANVALGELEAARGDLDEALQLAADDPLAWLLSATLARRMGDLERARTDISEAAARAPDDAEVAYEAGVIALLSDAPDAARMAWRGAIQAQPGSEAARRAQAALDRLGAEAQPAQP